MVFYFNEILFIRKNLFYLEHNEIHLLKKGHSPKFGGVMKTKINPLIIVTGLLIGIAAVVLTKFGNPKNMGFCIACFIRDIAGTTKLHSAGVVQYLRPEIVGIVLGSTIMAFASGEWRAKAGSSPALRFILGFMVMVGALIFLGCPLRMVIRMGGGDLNAFVGLAGFVVGILIGVVFLKKGFGLKRNYDTTNLDGLVLPVVLVVLFVLFMISWPVLSKYVADVKAGVEGAKNTASFAISTSGPGSMHAPIMMALIVGLIVGVLAQKSRMCMVGGIRDIVMFKNFNLIIGFVCVFIAVLVGNVVLGNFKGFSTLSQPIAHSSQVWNFLGMVIVGWGSCLLGGCPLRQLILAGEGNGDSAVTVIGMFVGAAFAHNFALAGGADPGMVDGAYKVFSLSNNGKLAAICCLIALLIISCTNLKAEEK